MSWFSRVTLLASPRGEGENLRDLRVHPYRQHQALWRMFECPEGTPQPFLFRQLPDEDAAVLRFLVVSKERPREIPGWRVECKPYQPRLREGNRYRFDIRLNPTRTEPSPDGRGKRQDYVMSRLHQLQVSPARRAAERQRVVHEELPEWLRRRGERNGFVVESCHVGRYEILRMQKGIHAITLGVAEFSGILRVQDPEKLATALLNGLGHGRSFGLGLLLLKPC
jgi:CRISPR-associated protein Cas6/Cse3/CasE, subtype I-E/ECOLI